ncbi:septation ring formation regulator EzrA [Fructilactobacillus myrtifloralis]|uniref:Septation ring formation regulator EzrA n=1 Tax=Fructilactobacillus myrtifloralis TaxID=2940301 RepID=A0ABY5BNJ4_9LACO|nr:septation ring formation regulator EzrA [Fructilactobacillus myrtifloralis]USS85157.1 septation ring formation regulator EzrA [Fructilactobacillus myrtifloralis]
MLNVIVGIIVIVVIIYIAIVLYQKTLLKQGKAMEAELNRLQKLDLPEQLTKVKKLVLTGDSLTRLETAERDYEQVRQSQFPQIAQDLTAAEQAGKGLNFLKTRDDIDNAHAELESAAKTLDQVQATLVNLQKMEQKHQQAVVELQTNYQKLRTTLLNDNSAYGPALDALEQQLSAIEAQFAEFTTLTQQGDHQKAEKLLVDLKDATTKLEQQMRAIPELYQLNHVQFVNQLMEIKSSYAKAKAEGFCFANDEFPATLQELHEAVQANLENIKHLDLDVVRDQDQVISEQINALYDQLEAEMKARLYVDKHAPVIAQFIQHAHRQNQALGAELEKLSHNYSLEHEEQATATGLGDQIDLINQKYQDDQQQITDQRAVYSQIANDLKQFQQDLTKIEEKQRALNASIADFSAEEQRAHQVLDDLTTELHAIRRRIDNLNLPGIPADYAEYFDVVANEVQHLKATMNKVKISMDDVQKQLTQIQHDRDTLQTKTNDLIDQAALAEQVIQYANRYAATNPAVASAIQTAQHQFDDDYQYEASLATIANALDQAEPGAFNRIEENYYKNKAQAN